ncbi:hypothetical protein GUITHDRAFT_147857 [Guillardia theta CCMP2712]|uniref:C2 domain-containing protein n=1 Tax=Guillardia theta (strain CCMP2712) TaxID=905079 RepID=L1IBA5_GUITC|nr:hypothetical protein GUITHDRAFT_147857 [Guillardia theta CCMP2712]EKX33546.1 hypothetical protein GUITHDRAFT_147857 [Guillardia theta CCMP2712]|eukprot:XP_005820526.1 hypothetical protein GUITHDRAFT_147857 [Guillardia theta CCMP2712]
MEGMKAPQPLLLLLFLPPGSSDGSQVTQHVGYGGGRLALEQIRSYFQSIAGEVQEVTIARSGRNGSIRFRRPEGTQRALKQQEGKGKHSIDGVVVSVSLPFEMRMEDALNPLKQIVGENNNFFKRSSNNLPLGSDCSILYLNVKRLRELPAPPRGPTTVSHVYVRVGVGEKQQTMKMRIKASWINPVFTFNESFHFELQSDGSTNHIFVECGYVAASTEQAISAVLININDDLLDRSIWHDLRSLADYDPFAMFESKGMSCMGKLELVASLKKNNTMESEVEETRSLKNCQLHGGGKTVAWSSGWTCWCPRISSLEKRFSKGANVAILPSLTMIHDVREALEDHMKVAIVEDAEECQGRARKCLGKNSIYYFKEGLKLSKRQDSDGIAQTLGMFRKAAICEARKPLRPEIKHEAFMQIGGKLEIAWQAYSTKSASQFEQLRCLSGDRDERTNNDDNVNLLFNAGLNLFKGKRYTEAIVVLDEVLRLNPEHIKALRSKALACRWCFAVSCVCEIVQLKKICSSPVKRRDSINKVLEVLSRCSFFQQFPTYVLYEICKGEVLVSHEPHREEQKQEDIEELMGTQCSKCHETTSLTLKKGRSDFVMDGDMQKCAHARVREQDPESFESSVLEKLGRVLQAPRKAGQNCVGRRELRTCRLIRKPMPAIVTEHKTIITRAVNKLDKILNSIEEAEKDPRRKEEEIARSLKILDAHQFRARLFEEPYANENLRRLGMPIVEQEAPHLLSLEATTAEGSAFTILALTDMELFAVSAADFMIQEAESISRDLDERLRWSLYRETVACQEGAQCIAELPARYPCPYGRHTGLRHRKDKTTCDLMRDGPPAKQYHRVHSGQIMSNSGASMAGLKQEARRMRSQE